MVFRFRNEASLISNYFQISHISEEIVTPPGLACSRCIEVIYCVYFRKLCTYPGTYMYTLLKAFKAAKFLLCIMQA